MQALRTPSAHHPAGFVFCDDADDDAACTGLKAVESTGPDPLAPLVFWGLMLMGLAGLAFTSLYPEWQELKMLEAAAAVQEQRLASLQQHHQRLDRELHALRSDPGVVGRLAQRELGYVLPARRTVYLSGQFAGPPALPDEPVPTERAATGVTLGRRYEALQRVVEDYEARALIQALCVGVMVAAMIIFRDRPPA